MRESFFFSSLASVTDNLPSKKENFGSTALQICPLKRFVCTAPVYCTQNIDKQNVEKIAAIKHM
jgi:hypothetical protein